MTTLEENAGPVNDPTTDFNIFDPEFVRDLLAQTAVTVLPGSYVGRTVDGVNPGQNRIRIALVAPLADCVEAAHRIADFVQKNFSKGARR